MPKFLELTDINLVTSAINLDQVLAFVYQGPEPNTDHTMWINGQSFYTVLRPLMTVSLADGTPIKSVFIPDGKRTVPERGVNASLVGQYWTAFLDRLDAMA